MADHDRSSRLNTRSAALAIFAVATLLLLAAGALEVGSLLAKTLYGAQEQEAAREARLIADVGLAAALQRGPLTAQDLPLAAAEYAAARRRLPLTGMALWQPNGVAVYTIGDAHGDLRVRAPAVVRAAFATGTTQSRYAAEPGAGQILAAAVPLGARGADVVAEFHFSRRGVERNVVAAKRRLYVLTGIGALIMYLAVLPLLARVAKRLPPPIDRRLIAALAELQHGIARNELRVVYQPKVDLATHEAVGVEALVRWQHPKRGLLGPSEFLPVAETSARVLSSLTWRVLDLAIRDCAAWLEAGRNLPVTVNVAAPVLRDAPLVERVREALEVHGVPPRMLTLEVTESALMEHGPEVTATLASLRSLGIAISIDDFGTGHSSLARLRSMPFDEIKVDRTFIREIATDKRDLSIMQLIVQLGETLGLTVVAEGIEDPRTLALLAELGCPVGQGYVFSPPLREDQLMAWLDSSAEPCASVT